jgi:prolipoprotein diacylglyceryltransferase
MHPELLNIFGFKIAWYSVLIGTVLAGRMAVRRGLNNRLLSDMTVWVVLWGVAGA